MLGDVMGGLVCEHALTRSVRDSAALLDATAGPDLGDPYWAPPPARPFLEELAREPTELRIALSTTAFTGVPVHDDCVRAAKHAAALCEQLGHRVQEADPGIDAELNRPFMAVWAAGVASSIEGWTRLMGRPPADGELEPLTRSLGAMGRQVGGHEVLLAMTNMQQVARQIAGFMERFDVWLTPTLAEPPPPLGQFEATADDPLAGLMHAAAMVPFTPLANITGQPAMNVPLVWNEQGLPIGVHFAARFGDEATLFRLAAQLERAEPWADRHPPLAAG